MATSHPSSTITTPARNGNGTVASPDTTPCTSQAPVITPRKRRPHRIYQPTKNSLYDIFQQHSGISLFVRPICWTDLHAQLLGARWDELPPCDTPHPTASPGTPPSRGHLSPSNTIITLSNALTQILLPDAMHPILASNAVKTVLMTLWPTAFSKPQYLPELHLYFGGRVYRDAVRAQLMWNFPAEEPKSSYSSFKTISTRPAESFNVSTQSSPTQCPANLPMICYIGKTQLASVRNNLFRVAPGPGRSWNEPVFRLQQLRARILIPSNSDHDAHFVGIFLGMAQKHFYPPPPITGRRDSRMSPEQGIPPCPNFHDLKLKILTHDTETSEFIVYTGNITKEFLEKFHDPFKASTDDDEAMVSGLKIEYTRVPIWPILGLRERLGKALGQDVVGAFDPDVIETWEKDPEKQGGEKRKREVITEVVNSSNSSFEEGEEEEPAVVSKKRCLNEGTPVGVVM
ncbi:Ff.00g008480.m01.CDS01 [Fusarium sp. VM40]|nr:Ff.00g008480.m01.CDS01 [Fusarium sp. VM40]